MNGTHHEEESSWDSLASELGLEPAPMPAPPPPLPPEPVVTKRPERPAPVEERETPPEEFGGFLNPTAEAVVDEAAAEPQTEEPGVEDAADVLDDEAPEGVEGAAGEEQGEGEGKGRRRRRRRRRGKKGAPDVALAEGTGPVEADTPAEADVLAFAPPQLEEVDEELPEETIDDSAEIEEGDDEVEEIIPTVGLAEELEEESAEPLPEWKVTSWTELVTTLYRPQDR